MSTPAVYTFKGDPQLGRQDLHLVYHSDGYPKGASDLIPDLAKIANRIWSGEDVDLESVQLPSIDEVELRVSLEESQAIRSTPFRYEIAMVDERPVMVRAFRHAPVISEELEQRLTSAREALAEVEKEMQEAWRAPTYTEIGSGSLTDIKELGLGHED